MSVAFFLLFFFTALASANHGLNRGLDEFDDLRENTFHDLTNDEELAKIEDERLEHAAEEIAEQNELFKEVSYLSNALVARSKKGQKQLSC